MWARGHSRNSLDHSGPKKPVLGIHEGKLLWFPGSPLHHLLGNFTWPIPAKAETGGQPPSALSREGSDHPNSLHHLLCLMRWDKTVCSPTAATAPSREAPCAWCAPPPHRPSVCCCDFREPGRAPRKEIREVHPCRQWRAWGKKHNHACFRASAFPLPAHLRGKFPGVKAGVLIHFWSRQGTGTWPAKTQSSSAFVKI